jgi:hypothetical protein
MIPTETLLAVREALEALPAMMSLSYGDLISREQAVQAVAEVLGRDAWRPVETAPFEEWWKDDTCLVAKNILIANAKGEVMKTDVLRKRKRDGLIGLFANDFVPVLWHPVPQPPAGESHAL